MQNCFGHYAQKYFELGMNVIPISENKKPPYGFKWGEWQERKQTQDDIDYLVSQYGSAKGIAIVCGKTSGVVGFDFDYKYDQSKMQSAISKEQWEKDYKKVESLIQEALPTMQPAKKGRVGWTVFFKWSEGMAKTISVDRYGVRLFDFKATGYIVMPPSLHSQQPGEPPVFYQWLNGSDEYGLESLDPIDERVVLELSQVFGQGASAKETLLNSRHGRLFVRAMSLCQVEHDDEKVIAKLLEADFELHSKDRKGPYFQDSSCVGSNPKLYAKQWVTRIRKFVGSAPKKGPQTVDPTGWDYFFEKNFHQVRKDKLTKDVVVKYLPQDDWEDIRKYKGYLKTLATRAKLKKDDVQDELERYCATGRKLELLCDIPKWDGVDRVHQMASALRSDFFTTEQVAEIVKRWGAGVFARMDDSSFQNPSLILQGKQGIGKDFWIESLVSALEPYHQKPILTEKRKDIMESLTRVYICHIEEFDQTAVLDPGFIKSIITQNRSMYREAYGFVASAKPLHHSVIASVNPLDFLRDTTGNRRFVVLPLSGIDRNYPTNQSRQILAQFQALYHSKKLEVSPETQAKIDAVLLKIAPENLEEVILDHYRAYFLQHLADPFSKVGAAREGVPEPRDPNERRIGVIAGGAIVQSVAKAVDVRVSVVRAALKRNNLVSKSNSCHFYRLFIGEKALWHSLGTDLGTALPEPFQ